jgi:glycosyltransferase involved in cell wall biosynthesis
MNFYLEKFGFQAPSIVDFPKENLGICVVIPCFNEPDLLPTLNALSNCFPTTRSVEIIVVINSGEHHPNAIKEQNARTLAAGKELQKTIASTWLDFHFIDVQNLPQKHAGVGLARKIGMDEAVHRFDLLKRDGIIVCFDADSTCEPNYLKAIERHFDQYPNSPGCSIFYEHPIEGDVFDREIYDGITFYELHLRYYNLALNYCHLPYAFHTVGSSMAVRSSAYQKQGGMNKRKAGEDFYFIHKIIELGGFTNLTSTTVIPSPRISDRVPFGTGKAIGDWILGGKQVFTTYSFASFKLLKAIVEVIPELRTKALNEVNLSLDDQEKSLLFEFLKLQNFESKLAEIRANAKTEDAFIKRFFRWLDAFTVLKFMHFVRDNGYSPRPIEYEVIELLKAMNMEEFPNGAKEQLIFLRKLERVN